LPHQTLKPGYGPVGDQGQHSVLKPHHVSNN